MTMPKFSMKGRVVLVTGGGRGIGKAIALGFARAGADVVVASRTASDLDKVAREIEALGGHALAVQADIAVKSQVDNMVAKALDRFGTIDVLVNNAAINVMRPLVDLREDGWDKVMNVGLKGYFLCSQAVARVMMARKSGNIISIASDSAVKAAPMLGAYSISKAGVVMLTQVFAVELAPYGIRVNAIGPGMVKTGFSQPLWSDPNMLKMIENNTPLRRLAEAEEIASVALFLASDAASYITGQTIYADGGILA
ncbi:MAG: 3-oxoacyl-ACP reductase FabG [Chloroflexi bacterium]|nr:3-oxoacyl-ACP reductase FabG [Chloroflexota bacterium]